MPSRPLSRALMHLRRFRYWLGQFHWWAITALIAGLLCVVIAFATDEMVQVTAVGALSITLAILSTRENAP